MDDKGMRARLVRAQAGDEDALREVALYVYNRYQGRIRAFFSVHPVYDVDDMLSTFFEAILRHVPLADGRGDDFYHIGQRGYWAVASEVRAYTRERRHRTSPVVSADYEGEYDPIAALVDPNEPLTEEMVTDRLAAEQEWLGVMELSPQAVNVACAILDGAGGDPRELGFNKRVAAAIDRSPQRVSQLMAELRLALESQAA